MKKGITVLLALVMAVTLIPVCAFAQSGDTLTVQTRSSEYVFHVGDTFTYSYWLSLKPDVVNYSEDYLKELLGTSYGGDKELTGIGLADLTKLKLKSVSGNIKYDTECLSLVSAETPNIKLGLTKQKSDALGGTILDGTLFDFTNADLAFFSNIMTKAEKAQFNDPKVLVRCTFRVISGSDTPVYLRTKLTHLEVTTQKLGKLVKEQDIKLVHGRTAFFPYESFETVDDEEPAIVLKSLVDDVGLDIRYFNISGDVSQYRRPGKGVTATMMGFSSDGRYVKLQQQTDGSEVMWLYDVPYGQYYVDCSFTNEQGKFFATPDPEKAEHINVPATGEIQALWLIETEPSKTKQINVYVDWVGDEDYLPARPEYLHMQLYNEQDVAGLVLQQQIMQRTDNHISFDNVNINDRSGQEIAYKLKISAQGDSYAQYHYDVKQDGNDFYVTATYYGSPEDLWKIPVDQGGHYWVAVETTEPTCTLEGKTYYVCDVCHETKYVTVPAQGHTVVTLPAIAASCTTVGRTEGSYCTVCSKVLRAQMLIPALGHTPVTDAGYPATCTENGVSDGTHCSVCGTVLTEQKVIPATGHDAVKDEGTPATCTGSGLSDGSHCAVCGKILQEQSLIPAKGHRYENGVCTECGKADPDYVDTPAKPVPTISIKTDSGKPTLKWAAVDGATKYEIWRATSKNGTYTKYYTTSNTSYTNSSAVAGKTYYYKVKAIAANGNASDYSAIKSITCDCAQPVATITTNASSGKPTLKWSAVDGATKYEIWRATSKNGTYTKYYTTSNTSYSNTSAVAGKTYYYKVKAICGKSSYGNSAFSAVKSITCDCARPVVSITTSNGHPKLSWKAINGAAKYDVYRATRSNGTYTKLGTTSKLSYTNTGAKAGTTYYYKVIAVCGASSYGNSSYSKVVSIKAK